ncbi:MAG: 8-oxoguanine deaminase [Elusimicrobiales bacterium]|nr:8-oxoguanine deaminase [Elusimicrobiales bacterium]
MSVNSLLIKNASWIFTGTGKEIKDSDIYCENGIIKKIAKNINIKAKKILNAKNCVVTPGLINTHHHFYQTLTRNIPMVQDAKLFDWLVYLYKIWKNMDEEWVEVSTKVAIAELLLSGCTTSSDHLYLFPKKSSKYLIDVQINAAKDMKFRFIATRGSMSRGESKGGLPPDDVVQNEDEILKDCQRVIEKYHSKEKYPMIQVALAPCSPFSVTTELLKQTYIMAKEYGVRLHTHLAETIDEEKYCLEKYNMKPVEYMESVGWLDGGISWFAHCVYINEDEANKMAKGDVGVAHCPTSNLRLGSGIAPIKMFINKGIKVGLGVDGSASNDSSNIINEARMAMLISRIKYSVNSMTARDALLLATKGGADILGRNDIGIIEIDKAADFAIFDISGIEFCGSEYDKIASILFCGPVKRAKYTIVNGNILVDNFNLTIYDEEKIKKKAFKIVKKIMDKL